MKNKVALVFFLILLSCASNDVGKRFDLALNLTNQNNWQKQIIKTNSTFDFVAFEPKNKNKSNLLTIFIEGDGFSWSSRYQVSNNPTPKDPAALKMALKYGEKNKEVALYLARPCQYIDFKTQPNCYPKYWSDYRFAQQVIDSTNIAIDLLKKKYHSSKVKLIGYSGGGAVAALVATKRSDVKELITIAGNLDIEEWVNYHHISKLSGSLNPADYADILQKVPQRHYVGLEDKIIPSKITQHYVDKLNNKEDVKIFLIEKFNHKCCWSDAAIIDQL